MDEEQFLAEIRRRPDDNGPRLVYADWLDERGDPLGEFLRLQCLIATLPAEDPSRPALLLKNRQLESEQRSLALVHLTPLGVRDLRFHRGFVDRIHVSGTRFLDLWRPLVQFAPALRGIRWSELPLVGAARALERLLTAEHFSAVDSLSLYGNTLGPPVLETLAECAGTARLVSLDFGWTSLAGAALQAFARSRHLHQLRTLKASQCRLNPRDALLLARCASLDGLWTLDLSRNEIGDDGFAAIVSSRSCSSLRSLNVARNGIGIAGIQAFADASRLSGLTSLNLSGNDLGDDGARLLASSSSCGRLSELLLSDCGLTSAGREAVQRSAWMPRLQTLEIDSARS